MSDHLRTWTRRALAMATATCTLVALGGPAVARDAAPTVTPRHDPVVVEEVDASAPDPEPSPADVAGEGAVVVEEVTDEPPSSGRFSVAASGVPAAPTKKLPSLLDVHPGYQATTTCDPTTRPGVLAFAQLVTTHYKKPRYHTSRSCKAGDSSQHYEGRALDWTMNAYDAKDKALAASVTSWLTADRGAVAKRFGIMYMIWNKKIWYVHRPGAWEAYSGPSPHTDHIHFSFTWDGAMKRTSWWTGKPVTTVDHGPCRTYAGQYAARYTERRTSPCPTKLPSAPRSDYPVRLPGAVHAHVKIAQAAMGMTGADLDGSFGPRTLATLLAFQKSRKVPVTGVLDNATWAALLAKPTPRPDRTVAPPPARADGTTRVYGPNRYATAVEISRSTFPGGTNDVFVVTGTDWPDALAAGAAAAKVDGAVLLVQGSSIPKAVLQEIERLDPRRAWVVGGEGVVGPAVVSALQGRGIRVERLAGRDRYATATAVQREFFPDPAGAYYASGATYADALGGGAAAAHRGWPLLLTAPTALPSSTPKVGRERIVLGGTGAVSDRVVSALSARRVHGEDRYATAAAAAADAFGSARVAYLATGATFPDALAAAVAAHRDGAPVLITASDCAPEPVRKATKKLGVSARVVLGGSTIVGDGAAQLKACTS